MHKIELGQAFLIWREGTGNTIEIFDIHVPSHERRLGRGRRLMEMLVDPLSDDKVVWAITRATNKVGQQFYENLNFKVMAFIRDIYGDGEHGIMYGRRKGDKS